MLRRKGDGCSVSGALRIMGDQWTMLVIRDLAHGPRRSTELLRNMHPISSRTLFERLRHMEQDSLILRSDYGGSPPRVEYALTPRGRLLFPLLEELRRTGELLGECDCLQRINSGDSLCEICPERGTYGRARHPSKDESIVLL